MQRSNLITSLFSNLMNRKFTGGYQKFACTIAFALAFTMAKAAYIPVSLTGYNADVVANGTGLPTTSTSIAFDSATATTNYVLVADNYQVTGVSPLPTYSIASSGIVNSAVTSGLAYTLASFNSGNSLRLVGTSAPKNTGTLTFPTPNYYIGDVYILAAAASGSATATFTLNFTGGGTQTYTTTVEDWMNGTTPAAQGIGRALRSTGTLDAAAGATNPRLFEIHIPISSSNLSKTIQSITVTRTGGSTLESVLNVLAVTVDNQNCLPVTGLAASQIKTTSANLNWNAVAGANGYEYAITTSSVPPASGTPQTATSYSASGLNPGTVYYLHVRSSCPNGSFSGWTTLSFTTPIIVNRYAGVVGYDDCNNRLIVDDATGFNIGDTVMLFQMKTYAVDSSNTQTFGDTLAYQGAGNYEYNVIRSKNGNTLGLKYKVKRTYQWTLGKVQLIRIPTYQNYTVNTPLTCLPWDGTKGGILAFKVINTLTLNADIDVTGNGFKGGAPLYSTQFSCNKTDYYYDGTTNFGAAKGEGIGVLSPSKLYGRGKLTNGGGGGNDNNSGGGGGSNGGTGGDGGYQYQAAIWCTSSIIPNIGGIGGLKLSYNNLLNKVFLGGGGGAGHGDNMGETGGGNGGGVVIIDADNIIGNNHIINANGDNAPQCTGAGPNCQDDGTGGGGGAGVVAIKANSITNLLQVNAKGGKGANAYSSVTVNATFATGPGGGGSGGIAWFSAAANPVGVAVNTSGGAAGVLPQFLNTPNGATPGDAGATVNNLALNFPVTPQDTFPIKHNLDYKDSIISCATVYFQNLTVPATNVFAWWWSFGDGDTSFLMSPTHTYGTGGTYTVKLAVTDNGGCTDTLVRVLNLNSINYSITDTVLGCKTIEFGAVQNSGPGGMTFDWDYGDNDTGSGNPSTHVYQVGGDYTVVLTVTDSTGCQDTTHLDFHVEDITAAFTVSDDTICQGESVTFTDASGTNAIFYAWTFGNGLIDSAQNPVQVYPNSGVYPAKLVVGEITGCLDSSTLNIVVDSISPVDYIPSDTLLCEGQTIILTAYYLADNVTKTEWDLGDGFKLPNSDSVKHAYDTSGNFNITLTVKFRACPDIVFAKDIHINPFPELNLGPDTSMCPNGPALVLVDNINISNPDARWHWNTGDSTSSLTVYHPGIYMASVNVDGCVTNDSVEVFKDCYIDIPNAFTPDNDGANDYFLPRQLLSENVSQFKMVIYNRWGQQVFQTVSVNGRGWDGKFNGQDQPMGVYVYKIDVSFRNGATESYTGNLTLLR